MIDGSIFSKFANTLALRSELLMEVIQMDMKSIPIDSNEALGIFIEFHAADMPEVVILYLGTLLYSGFLEIETDHTSPIAQLESEVLKCLPESVFESHNHTRQTLTAVEMEINCILEGESLTGGISAIPGTEEVS